MGADKDRSPLAWTLGSFALGLATLLRVSSIEDGQSGSYVVGAALGSLAISLLVAALLRLGYVKLTRKGRPVWTAWTLVIAAVITLFVSAGRASEAESASASKCGAPALAGPLEACGRR